MTKNQICVPLGFMLLTGCSLSFNRSNQDEKAYIQALGKNPNWSVEVLENAIIFHSEDFFSLKRYDVSTSHDGEFLSFQNIDKAQKFSLVLEKKPCLDKVTSMKMRYIATFTFGDITYLGCAQKIK